MPDAGMELLQSLIPTLLSRECQESATIFSRGNQLDLSIWMAMSQLFGTAPDHSLLHVVHIIFVKT
jgi:hypothetical protein